MYSTYTVFVWRYCTFVWGMKVGARAHLFQMVATCQLFGNQVAQLKVQALGVSGYVHELATCFITIEHTSMSWPKRWSVTGVRE